MRGKIESAPRDGKFVILEEDGGGKFIVGRWSPEARGWVCEDGEPIKITPSYWHPVQGEIYLQQELLVASPSLKSAEPQPTKAREVIAETVVAPVAVPTDGPQPAPIEVSRTPQRRWRFAASSIAASIFAAALAGMYFRAEITSHLTQYLNGGSAVSRQAQAVQAKELAEARHTVDELEQSLVQERGKTAALAQEVGAAREALTTRAAQHREALEQERERGSALAGELAAARRDLDARAALANKAGDEATQLRKAAEARAAELQQERDRTAALASELAAMREEFKTKSLSSTTADEVAQLKQMIEATKATTAELQRSLQQERDKAAVLARDLETAQRLIGARAASDRPANSQAAQTRPTAAPASGERPLIPQTQGDDEASRLIARASALIAQGNIGAARIVLERAVEMGNAEASFALAETYDPRILSSWGTYGTRGDVSKARELYGKATAGGIREAQDRYNALRQ